MSELVHIPREGTEEIKPSWIAVVDSHDNKPLRPLIRCRCGRVRNISNHHVHADGRVTASFYCADPLPAPCGWHVFLFLDGYDGQEWEPILE